MSVGRAFLVSALFGCGGSRIAATAEAGDTGWADGSGADAAVHSGQDGAADVSEAGDGSTGDAGMCSGGTFTASVDGSSVTFAACVANAIGAGSLMSVQCGKPTVLTIRFTRSAGNTWKAFVEYWRTGTRFAEADGAITVTAIGDVGGFVDGSASAPKLQGPSGTVSLQGSFHVCRGPDLQAPP
jgi:hypothetical protein